MSLPCILCNEVAKFLIDIRSWPDQCSTSNFGNPRRSICISFKGLFIWLLYFLMRIKVNIAKRRGPCMFAHAYWSKSHNYHKCAVFKAWEKAHWQPTNYRKLADMAMRPLATQEHIRANCTRLKRSPLRRSLGYSTGLDIHDLLENALQSTQLVRRRHNLFYESIVWKRTTPGKLSGFQHCVLCLCVFKRKSTTISVSIPSFVVDEEKCCSCLNTIENTWNGFLWSEQVK